MVVPRRTLTLLRRLANQVGATTDDTVRALAQSWSQAWDELSHAWQQGIAALLDEYQRTGRWPAPWQAARIEAIARAQERTEQALGVLVAEAAGVTRAAASEVSAATLRAEPDVIASQRAGLDVSGASRSRSAHALSSRQSRITELHQPFKDSAIRSLRHALARPAPGAGLAQSSQEIYNRARSGFETALTRSATVARTELPDTYRTASGLAHEANAVVVSEWAWLCSCDRRACLACWALHGRRFSLDVQGPDGHPSCRCARLPLVGGNSLPSAEARFRRLARREQIAILGPGRFELWRLGRVAWADLATRKTNKGWRDSHVPTPVARLQLLADSSAA